MNLNNNVESILKIKIILQQNQKYKPINFMKNKQNNYQHIKLNTYKYNIKYKRYIKLNGIIKYLKVIQIYIIKKNLILYNKIYKNLYNNNQ